MKATEIKQIVGLSIFFLICWVFFSQLLGSSKNQLDQQESAITEDYFRGKTIEWIVPFKEGGGGDTWARFNAPFLQKHLRGNPSIVISNIPGGGSIKGSNLFATRAKPNGLLLLGTSGSTQMPFLLEDPRMRFDYANYTPVMAYPNGGVVYASTKLGIKSAEDIARIKDIPLIYASQGPTSLDLVPDLGFHLLGLNVKTVFGFRGRGAGRLAFERGEVLIDYQTSSAYLKNVLPLVESGEAVPLWSWGVLDENGALARDPSFPDLPHFGEVFEIMHGKKGSGLAYDSWFATMAAGFGGMKLLLVPKETPEEILQIYQEAITKMRKDPDYVARKTKAIGLYPQVIGETALNIFDLATNINQAEKEWCKNYLRQKYDLNI